MMKQAILLLLFPILSFGQKTKDYSIGEIHKIESAALKETRILNVYLPLNYSKDSIYPVMYVLDGSAHEDFLHIVGLVQFFQLQLFMPEIIIVGIENVDRKRDFTFHTDKESLVTNFPTCGHSAEFMQFVEKEMQPYIESQFKTNSTKFLVGQSLGGLMASEILLKKPELFSHYLIVSPSLWWDKTSMLKQAGELLKKQTLRPEFVYIAVGKKEHRVMRRDARKLYRNVNKYKTTGQKRYLNKMKGENHATILHNAIYQGLEKLYPYVGSNFK
jgi:hypothetical protein